MRLTVTALALTFALGCGAAPDKDKKDDPKSSKPRDGAEGPRPLLPPVEDPKAAAQTFATDFFAAVKAKKASPDQLTADFKKLVAPPFGSDDAAKGYSDEIAATYLEKWAAVTADAPRAELVGDVAFADGKPGPGGRILMRLAKDGGAWKADWLSNGPPTADPVSLTGGEDTVAVLFAVAAFTDAALKRDYTLAAGLMTPAGRTKIAPAFDADLKAGRTYKPSILKDEIEKAVGKADRAAVTGNDRTGGDATVTLALTGGAARTELTLKLVKGPKPGVWLVDAFDAK